MFIACRVHMTKRSTVHVLHACLPLRLGCCWHAGVAKTMHSLHSTLSQNIVREVLPANLAADNVPCYHSIDSVAAQQTRIALPAEVCQTQHQSWNKAHFCDVCMSAHAWCTNCRQLQTLPHAAALLNTGVIFVHMPLPDDTGWSHRHDSHANAS